LTLLHLTRDSNNNTIREVLRQGDEPQQKQSPLLSECCRDELSIVPLDADHSTCRSVVSTESPLQDLYELSPAHSSNLPSSQSTLRAHESDDRFLFSTREIFVSTPTGKRICLNVNASDTVKIIKEKIQEKEGIPPAGQIIVYGGKY
ncbi:hypothetical protein PMAYCL1PPCAC_05409, partial [Pristionchus mayeri]